MNHRPVILALAIALPACMRDARSQDRTEQPAPRATSDVSPPTPSPRATDAGTAPATPPAQRSIRGVVMISIDSLRADMPWAGYPRAIAPNITRFSERAVRYTRAYAPSSYTSQSVGGMLASRFASELRRDGAFFNRYPRDNLFFPETLQSAGVRTMAAHAHFYFRAGFAGFEQGFDTWELVPGIQTNWTTDVDITGERHEAIAERLLSDRQNTGGRFFAWFHFMDAHDLYKPHDGIAWGRSVRDRYDGEVTWTDRWVGKLLEFIEHQPWANETAVILTSDHGEAFGEHGMNRHAFELWQVLVRVPLMVYVPGVAGRSIDVNRSQIDLGPTIHEMLGVPADPSFRGTSLVSEIRGGEAPDRDILLDLAQTHVSSPRRAFVHGKYKVMARGSRLDVYDIEADPGETRSLRTTEPAVYDDMVARYRAATASLHEVQPYGRNFRNRD